MAEGQQPGLEELPRLQSEQLAILESLLNLEEQGGTTGEKVKAFQADAASIILLLRTSVTSMAKAYNEARRFESEGKVSRVRSQIRKMEKFGKDLEEVKSSYKSLDHSKYVYTSMIALKEYLDDVIGYHIELDQELNRCYPEVKVEPAPVPAPLDISGNDVSGQGKLPYLTMPTYAGGLDNYCEFKENFEHLINTRKVVGGSRSDYLIQSLKGEAKQKCEGVVTRMTPYEEIWDYLDKLYLSESFIAENAIGDIFREPPPDSNFESVDQFWFKYLRHLKSLVKMGFTVEQLIIAFTIQTLPIEYQMAIEQELERLYPGQTKFTWQEAQIAYVNSIGKKRAKYRKHKGLPNTLPQPPLLYQPGTLPAAFPATAGTGGSKPKVSKQNPQPQIPQVQQMHQMVQLPQMPLPQM